MKIPNDGAMSHVDQLLHTPLAQEGKHIVRMNYDISQRTYQAFLSIRHPKNNGNYTPKEIHYTDKTGTFFSATFERYIFN